MRNLAPASTRRWRVPLAPDPASDAGADERVVASCHDPESRVVYCATDAGNLYGLRVDVDAADHDPVCLDMSLLDADHPDDPNQHGFDSSAPAAAAAAAAASSSSTSASALDRPLSSPRPLAVVGMEYLPEMQGVCVALADGRLLVVAPDPDHPALLAGESVPITRDCYPECVGVVSGGLRAASWNPDGETLALVTGAGALICMTKDFRVLAETPEGCGAGPGTANVSWRGDGQYLATLASTPGFEPATFRVWTRDDLEPGAEGERLDPATIASGAATNADRDGPPRADDGRNEHPPLAWQPRGALIAVATAAPETAPETAPSRGMTKAPSDATTASVVFYERNGLRRGAFALPRRGAGQTVTQLAWSPDSELLAVIVASEAEAETDADAGPPVAASKPVSTAVQIWRRGNGRWYLQRETRYPPREGAHTRVSWDDPGGHTVHALGGVEHVLRVYTSAGLVEEHAFARDAAVSTAGTVAVIDGASALVTPLSRAKLPPPMCAAEVRFPAPAVELAWARTTRGTAARGERVVALLADGRLAVAAATRGAEWEETAEALADDDDEDGADVYVEADVVEGNCASREGDVQGHVACVDEHLAMVCVENARANDARLRLATLLRDDETDHWTCAVAHEVALPRAACRVVPVEGGAPGRAFVILQPRADADGDAPAEILFAEATVHPETREWSMTVVPATWDEAALPTPCVIARAFDAGVGFDALDGGPNDGVAALAGLDARGTLRCGARVVAEDVRSFGVHWSASDGAVAAGSDAPDVSLDVAVSADASGGARATPRVVYVTRSDELRVAETPDLVGDGRPSRDHRRDHHRDDHRDHHASLNPNPNHPNHPNSHSHAAAAGGKRGADEGTGKGVYMDQLHVSMRAAMRPADASRAADVRTRRVEEGARIVAAVPGAVDVVLQMPRGNLETVAPRFLALPAVCAALDGERFAAAAALAARHRVDLNLLVDYRWPRFLARAEAFVRDVRDPDVVAEIIECLREDDVTAPGGVYAHLPKPSGSGSGAGAGAGFAEEENELARLAAGLRVGDEDGGTGAAPSVSASSGASAARDKVSSACAALRAAALATRDGVVDDDDDGAEPLLDDKWELVVLSSYARSEPPDAAAALRRVGRRRERELAEAAAVASSPVRDGPAGAAANDEGSPSAAASRDDDPDAIVVASGASTLEAAAAAGKDAGDPTPGRVSSSRLSSSTALRHLLALEGAKALFDAAIGTYDVSLAYLVGQNSNMDPGEFVPELRRLQAMPPALRRADVDLRLGRHASAVANLLEGGDVAGACEVAARRRLFPAALAAARAEPSADDPDGTPPRTIVARAYAAQLADESRHEDAAVTLLSVGDAADAARQYQAATAWRPALALAGRLGFSESERRKMAEELADALELADPASAAAVVERELGDVDRAVSLLCVARRWRECLSTAYANRRGDLVETVVAPAAAEAAQTARDDAAEAPARAQKYLERLRKLERHREAAAAAAAATATSAGYRGFGGAPGAGGDDDDDGASVASLSTLASGVSGMSAYTDRTLGAATTTTRTGASSRAASTVGGRAPKRKPKKKKKNSAGLRAGGPTEERDLATHLANGGVAETLLAEGALEEIGELAELLVILGAADDAAKLQRAVAAAMDASENAAAEARSTLAALDAAERVSAERGADPSDTMTSARDGTGAGTKPCDCPACRRAASTRTCAGKRQWKWAALRTAAGQRKE